MMSLSGIFIISNFTDILFIKFGVDFPQGDTYIQSYPHTHNITCLKVVQYVFNPRIHFPSYDFFYFFRDLVLSVSQESSLRIWRIVVKPVHAGHADAGLVLPSIELVLERTLSLHPCKEYFIILIFWLIISIFN